MPGCASGEEAYTIAIELNEALIAAGKPTNFRIIATDVHRGSIDTASVGVYSDEAMRNVPPAKRDNYFNRQPAGYVIEPSIRQKIIFSVHNVLSDPPLLNLDLVSCRNLLIYRREEAQNRVISMFMFGLRKKGYLLLGPSETLGKLEGEFSVVNARWRLFQKQAGGRQYDPAMLGDRSPVSERQTYPTRPRASELDSLSRTIDVSLDGVQQKCVVTMEVLDAAQAPKLMLVRLRLTGEDTEEKIDDAALPPSVDDKDGALLVRRVQEPERDLRLTEETLQHVTERLEASGEELQASNEELQASNEELQSSNEELHAVNEELVTVSAEHERKIQQLSILDQQTEHVLRILRTGMLHLDAELRLRRFSGLVASWFDLELHYIGRKLSVIGPRLEFVDLEELAARVLNDGTPQEVEGRHGGLVLKVKAHAETSPDKGLFLIFERMDAPV